MLSVQLITTFLAISQLLYTMVYFISFHRQQVLGKLYALYCLCLIGYLADNLPQLNDLPALNHLASFFAILAPGVFWVIARYYFEDEPRFSRWILLNIPFYVILRFVGVLAEDTQLDSDHRLVFTFFILPNIIMLALACHVVVMAIRGRQSDLVEARRRVRLPLVIITSLLLLVFMVTEILLLPNSHLNSVFFFILFLLTLTFNLRLPKLENHWLELVVSDPVQHKLTDGVDGLEVINPSAVEQRLITRIVEKMEVEHYYRKTGLTIRDLAAALELTEHRLRKVINHRLNYRNFNQFLNHYRIQETSRRLLNQEEAHLPILSIALDVGYRSLSSFNLAFMASHQMTPSEFRRKRTTPVI